ncbi:hypothetical protein Fcan01_11327 [Folsomia candida]|uniref:Uncharacterized protein n=1 Tax=Folsomia candida TaxID=158441 RepID=A0A226E9A8_FOLCA|nr:hypothetical protein Fcan01_11327 [Folsomia candida]
MKFLLHVAFLFVIISSLRSQTYAHTNNESSFIRIQDKASIKCNQQLKQISNLWRDLNKLRNSVKNSTIDPNLTLNKDPVPKFQSNTLKYFVELGHAIDQIELAVSIYNRKEIICTDNFSQEFSTVLESIGRDRSILKDWIHAAKSLSGRLEKVENIGDIKLWTGFRFSRPKLFFPTAGGKKWDKPGKMNFMENTNMNSDFENIKFSRSCFASPQSTVFPISSVFPISHLFWVDGQIAVSLRDKNFTASKEDLMEPKFFEIMRVFETLKNQTSLGHKNSKKYLLDFLSQDNTEILGKTIPAMIGRTRQIEKYCEHMVKELNDVEVLIRGWKVRISRLDAEFRSMLGILQLKSLKFEEDLKNCLIADYQALNGGKSGGKYLKRLEFMMRDEF